MQPYVTNWLHSVFAKNDIFQYLSNINFFSWFALFLTPMFPSRLFLTDCPRGPALSCFRSLWRNGHIILEPNDNVCHLRCNQSENVFAIVQNRPVFSINALNGASKRPDFDGYYLENRKKKIWPKFVWTVNRKPMKQYRCLSKALLGFDPLWPWTEIKDVVKFLTFAVLPPAGRFR